MPDVVLVDNDDHYREVLSQNLITLGFSVLCFANGHSLLEALSNGVEARVALLEWFLPEMSGFELLDTLRKRRAGLAVVFLTGHSLVEVELQALDRGAIDFISKARGIEVLAHRLRVILDGHRKTPDATPEVESHDELALYPSTARALWHQQDVGLTVAEYKVVKLLVSDGAIKSYREIYDTVHFAGFLAGHGEHGYTTNVRSFMKRIRKKFQAIDSGFSAIKNIRGMGYRWLGVKR